MSWDNETQVINTWVGELEALIYELDIPPDVLVQTRRFLTRAVDAGLASHGHSAVYIAISCFYIACRVSGVQITLDKLLGTPLAQGMDPIRVDRTVRSTLSRLGMRICPNCGAEPVAEEKFCKSCGTWVSRSIITSEELERCSNKLRPLKEYVRVQSTSSNTRTEEMQKIYNLLSKYRIGKRSA